MVKGSVNLEEILEIKKGRQKVDLKNNLEYLLIQMKHTPFV